MILPPTNQEKQFLPPNNFDNPGAELNLRGWATGSGSGAAPTTDQAESASDIALSRETSTSFVLSGSACLKITKPASNQQGEFLIRNFSISNSQVNRPNTLEFLYSASANFVFGDSGDIKVFIADLTTSQVISPFPNTLDGSGKFKGQWQASANKDYQLILWIPTTTTLAWDLYADSFKSYLSESIFIQADSDWVSYTPTGSWTTNTTYTGRYRKRGDSAEVQALVSVSGAPTAATLTINLPTGLTIDTNKLTTTTLNDVLGQARTRDDNVGGFDGTVRYNNTTSVQVLASSSTSTTTLTSVSNTTPFTFAANDNVQIHFTVPIQGWTSGYATPGVSAQNVPALFKAYKNGGSVTADTTIASWTATVYDSVGAWNGTSGSYTTKIHGYYKIDAFSNITTGDLGFMSLLVNGSVIATGTGGGNTTARHYVGTTIYLNVGDVVTTYRSVSATLASNNTGTVFTIEKLNDPNTFLNIPKIATIKEVQATNTNGGTATSGSWFTRTLNTLEDPYGIVSSLSSNQFTLQPGRYKINWSSPANQVAGFITRLYNVTTSTALEYGSGEFAQTAAANVNKSVGVDIVDISVATTFRIEMTVQTTKATNGLGNSVNLLSNSEVYTQVEIQKLL